MTGIPFSRGNKIVVDRNDNSPSRRKRDGLFAFFNLSFPQCDHVAVRFSHFWSRMSSAGDCVVIPISSFLWTSEARSGINEFLKAAVAPEYACARVSSTVALRFSRKPALRAQAIRLSDTPLRQAPQRFGHNSRSHTQVRLRII